MDEEFTEKEVEILRLKAEGYTSENIGDVLNLSKNTIDTYTRRITQKLKGTPFWDEDLSDKSRVPIIAQRYLEAQKDHPQVEHSSSDSEYIFTEQLDLIHKKRINGMSVKAIEAADDQLLLLNRTVRRGSYSDAAKHRLAQIRAKILFEKDWSIKEITAPDEIFTAIRPILLEQKELSVEYDDVETHALVCLSMGNTFYMMKEYDKSMKYIKEGLQHAQDVETLLMLYRTYALNAVYLNKKNKRKECKEYEQSKEFKQAEAHILTLIEGGAATNLASISVTYEGLARAQSLLKCSNATSTLEKAFRAYDDALRGNTRQLPLWLVQLTRSKLEVLQHTEPPTDKKLFEDIAQPALDIARDYGYQRWQELIKESLNKLL
jgi:hypothetical protein